MKKSPAWIHRNGDVGATSKRAITPQKPVLVGRWVRCLHAKRGVCFDGGGGNVCAKLKSRRPGEAESTFDVETGCLAVAVADPGGSGCCALVPG